MWSIQPRPPLETAITLSAGATGVAPAVILGATRVRRVCLARRDFSRRAVTAGYAIAEVAGALGLSSAAVSKMLRSGSEGSAEPN